MSKIKVTIDKSITDKEILGIVAGLFGAEFSAKIKQHEHNRMTKENVFLDFGIDVICTEEMMEKGLEQLLQAVLTIPVFCFTQDIVGAEYLFEQSLNKDTILSIAIPSKRHFAQVVGMLIAGEGQSLVDISKFMPKEGSRTDNILYYRNPFPPDDFLYTCYNLCTLLDLKFVSIVALGYKYKDMLQWLVGCKLVIGEASFLTYAAACLGIPCIEIFKTEEELNLLSKWSSKKYTVALEKDIENVSLDRLQAIYNSWQDSIPLVENVADGL